MSPEDWAASQPKTSESKRAVSPEEWASKQEPSFGEKYIQPVTDVVNRSLVAGTLGAPADIGALALRPFGYTQEPTFGSEYIGKQMEKAGMVSPKRRPVAELLTGFAPLALTGGVSAVRSGAGMVGRALGKDVTKEAEAPTSTEVLKSEEELTPVSTQPKVANQLRALDPANPLIEALQNDQASEEELATAQNTVKELQAARKAKKVDLTKVSEEEKGLPQEARVSRLEDIPEGLHPDLADRMVRLEKANRADSQWRTANTMRSQTMLSRSLNKLVRQLYPNQEEWKVLGDFNRLFFKAFGTKPNKKQTDAEGYYI